MQAAPASSLKGCKHATHRLGKSGEADNFHGPAAGEYDKQQDNNAGPYDAKCGLAQGQDSCLA